MRRALLTVACTFALAACEFARADETATLKANSCSSDAECVVAGELCMSGLCVAPLADDMLEVALQITPLPGTDSEAPHPVLVDGLMVKTGAPPRRVELPAPIIVSGRVRNAGAAIDASLSFIPTRSLRGITPATVTASTTRAGSDTAIDYSVQLSAGAEYRVLVRPVDTTLPPYHASFTASPSEDVSVDFADLETRTQTFMINAPADRTLLLRAFDLKTDEPISSTAPAVDGMATLVFGMDPVPYRLEIRAEQSYDPAAQGSAAEGFCDDDTPVYPIYSITEADLPARNRAGAIEIDLPEAPARIRYEGTVELCPAAAKGPVLSELPVTLHSRALLLPDGSPFYASFDAKTSAQLDSSTGALSFCVQLMEGEYDVVVTPPTSTPCAIYAQHRLIEAPDGKAASGAQLTLPASAALQGTLQTTDLTPVAGTTADAIALGRATGIEVLEEDMTLTRYNRSRQAVTGENGMFTIPVDLGSYDVLIKPPASSGFPWQVQHDVSVGKRIPFTSLLNMTSPAMLSGRLAYPATASSRQQAALAGAEVLAFAVIRDETMTATGEFTEVTKRAVPIGKVMADTDGSFILLLPQSINPEWW